MFNPNVIQYSDYFPFGMTMPGKSGGSEYRFGYQGQEGDDEVKGDGNSYTTEFRQLDPRIGRWLTIDPLFKDFPWISPYNSNNNNPILYSDENGDYPWPKIVENGYFSSGFKWRRPHPVLKVDKFHGGIDLAAKVGTPIHAAASGKIVYSGPRNGYGNIVVIDHGNGYYSQYAHLNLDGIYKEVGDNVSDGEHFADVGNSGISTGPHLHLEFHVLSEPFKSPQQFTPSGPEPGTNIDPTSMDDLQVFLNEKFKVQELPEVVVKPQVKEESKPKERSLWSRFKSWVRQVDPNLE